MGESSRQVTVDDSAAGSLPRSRSNWLIPLVAVAALFILVAYGLVSQRPLEEGPAPDFALDLFEGGRVSLQDTRGQVVVLNFWASWCPPCRDEAPALQRIWQRYQGSGVLVLGVNVKDVRDKALGFIDEFRITYPNGPDPYDRIASSYRVRKLPETFVIGKDGLVAKRFIGAVTEDQLSAVLAELLQAEP